MFFFSSSRKEVMNLQNTVHTQSLGLKHAALESVILLSAKHTQPPLKFTGAESAYHLTGRSWTHHEVGTLSKCWLPCRIGLHESEGISLPCVGHQHQSAGWSAQVWPAEVPMHSLVYYRRTLRVCVNCHRRPPLGHKGVTQLYLYGSTGPNCYQVIQKCIQPTLHLSSWRIWSYLKANVVRLRTLRNENRINTENYHSSAFKLWSKCTQDHILNLSMY